MKFAGFFVPVLIPNVRRASVLIPSRALVRFCGRARGECIFPPTQSAPSFLLAFRPPPRAKRAGAGEKKWKKSPKKMSYTKH